MGGLEKNFTLDTHKQTHKRTDMAPSISASLFQVGRNICHGSDAVESANHEIALWFKVEELTVYESAQKGWIYE